MNNEQPTHVDLFSGIGGFALAAAWAGFRTVAFCEIERYPQAVLRRHWPDVPIHSDIRNLDGRQYRGASLLTGGFPCQPFSFAGKRRGQEDDRYLWPEMLRVIDECEPTAIVGENVPGIREMALDEVLIQLESRNYSATAIAVPACAVGANHIRERIWILAYTKRERLPRCVPQNSVCEQSITTLPKLGNECFAGRNNWREHCRCLSDRNGLSTRMARLAVKAYGNAIVPQVAYEILKEIRKLV